MKRILNYPGSKWKLARTIVDIMPPHETYIEPFFGSGAVFFNKPAAKVTTINDMDSRIINFFRVCRDNPDKLIEKVWFTPHSREEYQLSYQVSEDPIEEVANCLKTVQIEHQDAIKLLERYNRKTVLAYVDPPYLLETRSKRMYACEFTNEDHERLLNTLNKFKGYVILSGYQSDFYDQKLTDWHKLEFNSVTEAGGRKLEVLWCNFEPPGQMSLFG